MFGLLNVSKPAGMTSRDVVNQIQRCIRPVKIGHAGTLDPLATGVLLVLLGNATRLTDYAHQLSKTYIGNFRLGCFSDTEDVEGQVVPLENPPQPSEAEIEAVLPQFVGTILQRPPIFSALKVQGARSYDLARQGKSPELASRAIEVHSIRILSYQYPDLKLEIDCGTGTYVRSLGRDIAEAVGTAAVMTELVRTRIGPWHLAESVPLAEVTSRDVVQQRSLPATQAVSHLAPRVVTPDEVILLSHGKRIPLQNMELTADATSRPNSLVPGQELAALTQDGELVAVVIVDQAAEMSSGLTGTLLAEQSPLQLKVSKFFPDCLANLKRS